MEALDGSSWDVLIAGTGIQQSLLALALSRSGKKIVHVDKNDYYGGAEAAFSLDEAQKWADRISLGNSSIFSHAAIVQPNVPDDDDDGPHLGFSRSYSLSLSPHLVYTTSPLVPMLVTSRTYRQLEFLALGTWWVYTTSSSEGADAEPSLVRIPSSREEIFADENIGRRAKVSLMKFMRFLSDTGDPTVEGFDSTTWEFVKDKSLEELLKKDYKLPESLQHSIAALAQHSRPSDTLTVANALPSIRRHLFSIGVFGPGFGYLIPKWGGLSEIAQVACRAGAVGGSVYVLGKGVKSIEQAADTTAEKRSLSKIELDGGDAITVGWIAGQVDDLNQPSSLQQSDASKTAHAISVVSSPLSSLLPSLGDGAPPQAGAVVTFPTNSIPGATAPIYLIVHSSDTGECPRGQCVLYVSTDSTSMSAEEAYELLDQAVRQILSTIDARPTPIVLWSMRYTQCASSRTEMSANVDGSGRIITFPPPHHALAFDDAIIDTVREAWEKITASDQDRGQFMIFSDREGEMQDDD